MGESEKKIDSHGKLITIPNILSAFRLILIPVFILIYVQYLKSGEERFAYFAAGVILTSCLSDIPDGWIARTFNQISDYGKVLDPVADKLTQGAVMICLLFRFPNIIFPLVCIVVKEITSFVLGLIMYKKTGLVKGAVWHGKVNTTLLFCMMLLHLVWPGIPPLVSNISIFVCLAMMIFSFVFYALRYIRVIIAGHDVKELKMNSNVRKESDGK